MTTKNEQENSVKPLDVVSFNAIAGAFARLQMLGDHKILPSTGDNTQAEREKLIEFLATELLAHCGEFLGAWQIANAEYLPLLRTLRAVATRAGLVSPPPVPPSNN